MQQLITVKRHTLWWNRCALQYTRLVIDSVCYQYTRLAIDSVCYQYTRLAIDSVCYQYTRLGIDSVCYQYTLLAIDSVCCQYTCLAIESVCCQYTRLAIDSVCCKGCKPGDKTHLQSLPQYSLDAMEATSERTSIESATGTDTRRQTNFFRDIYIYISMSYVLRSVTTHTSTTHSFDLE